MFDLTKERLFVFPHSKSETMEIVVASQVKA